MPIREGLFNGCISMESNSCWHSCEGPHLQKDPLGTRQGAAEISAAALAYGPWLCMFLEQRRHRSPSVTRVHGLLREPGPLETLSPGALHSLVSEEPVSLASRAGCSWGGYCLVRDLQGC